MEDSEFKEITIAILGPTGTGKSSFINLLSSSNLVVGGTLESCTTSVQKGVPFELDGYRVTLVDTPGFDDTTIRDTDVLAMISAYLSFEFKQGRMLTGVIYMHRILDNRVGGISSRNFRMFRNLCGDNSLRNVLIVTNFWDGVDPLVGQTREKELASKETFFKPVLDRGGRIVSHNPCTLESAQNIIRSFFGQLPQPLQIQNELNTGVDISETTAGKELNRDLAGQIEQHQQEMRVLVEQMNEANRLRDEETRKELAEDRAKLQDEIKLIQMDAKNMAASYSEALAKLQRQLDEKVGTSKGLNNASGMGGQLQMGMNNPTESSRNTSPDNAVVEAKLGGAFPIFGFWGRLSVMLSPFSLSWK